MYNLKDYQKEFLRADIEYFVKGLKYDILEQLEKLKGDRNFWFKLIRQVSNRSLLGKINYEAVTGSLEAISKLNLVQYQFEDKVNKVIIELYIDEAFFKIQEHLGIFKKFLGITKKEFVNKLSKELSETYHDTPIIEVLEE